MAEEVILKGKELEEYQAMMKAREQSTEQKTMEQLVNAQFEEIKKGILSDNSKQIKALYAEELDKSKGMTFAKKAKALQKNILGLIQRNRQQELDGFCELGGTEEMFRSGETQNEGTTTAGGHAIAPIFDTDVMYNVMKESVLYQKANVIPMDTLTAYFTPLSTGVSVTDAGETVAAPNTNFVLDQQTVTVKDTKAATVFSNNLLSDAPQLYQTLLGLYQEALKTKYNQILFTDATGSSKNFNGMLAETVTGGSTSLNGTTTGGAKTFYLAGDPTSVTNLELTKVVHSLSEEEWTNAEWYFNDGWSETLEALILDGTNRPLLFAPDGGIPTRLKSFPITRVRQMPNAGGSLTAGQLFAAFGDLKKTCHFWDRQGAIFTVVREGTVNGVNCAEQNATGLVMHRRHAFKVWVNKYNDGTRTGLTLIGNAL